MDKKQQFFFQKKKKIIDAVFDDLRDAVKDLVYISEIDSPVIAFAGGEAEALTQETILRHAGLDGDTPIEEVSFERFFARLTANKDWYGEREKTRAKKFLGIKKLLEENLRDLKVYRLGSVRIDIYAVGIDANGRVIGIITKAVET